MAMGEAAGTSAAMAVESGIQPRNVNHASLQDRLLDQDVLPPGAKDVKIGSGSLE